MLLGDPCKILRHCQAFFSLDKRHFKCNFVPFVFFFHHRLLFVEDCCWVFLDFIYSSIYITFVTVKSFITSLLVIFLYEMFCLSWNFFVMVFFLNILFVVYVSKVLIKFSGCLWNLSSYIASKYYKIFNLYKVFMKPCY